MALVGTPLGLIGAVEDVACVVTEAPVPAICAVCRQLERWMVRTVSWTIKAASRYRSILSTILRGHDEILSSFCGSCAAQTGVQSCDCMLSQYKSYGFPLMIRTTPPPADDCLVVYQEINVNECAVKCLSGCLNCASLIDPATALCIKVECTSLCAEDCIAVVFDPCNNPAQLDLLTRVVTAATASFNRLPTGSLIMQIIAILFPGGNHSIVAKGDGNIYIVLARDMTPLERTYLDFLRSLIPLGFGTRLHFARPCV